MNGKAQLLVDDMPMETEHHIDGLSEIFDTIESHAAEARGSLEYISVDSFSAADLDAAAVAVLRIHQRLSAATALIDHLIGKA